MALIDRTITINTILQENIARWCEMYALFSVSAHGNELSTPATALVYVLFITGTILLCLPIS